jgi:multidrug resistance efflux pump
MPTAFSRTLRLLNADGYRGTALGILAVALLLGAWTAWCVRAQVTVREVSSTARLEVDRAVYPIQSPTAGRVAETWLAVGRQVHAGDLLVKLDTSAEQLQAGEERARLAALAPQVEALGRQIVSEQEARGAEQEASKVAAEEAAANARQAEAPASYNAIEQERLQQLHAEGLIPERDYQRGRATAQQSHFAAEREQIAVRRIQQEQRTRESDRESRIRALEAEIVRLEGAIATSRAAIVRLENEIERRVVRAPASGRLGETAALRVGAVLREGDQVAALVPDGRLIVVAQFPPAAALGRIAPGQSAVLRLDGFPWMQYGPVPATVARVASEVRDGRVRVEMTVDPSRNPRVPLQHGLPGSVEVLVERVTPAALILRTAGRMMASSRSGYGQP